MNRTPVRQKSSFTNADLPYDDEMSLEGLIHQYGYVALFLGTLLEGETVLLMAGFAARCGFLSMPWVILTAFVGSTLGDQIWFFVGHKKGREYLAQSAKLNARIRRVAEKFEKHPLPIVMGFRFVYGLRSVTPLVIGASGFSPARFLVLNLTASAVWSVAVAVLGYIFGEALERIFHDVKLYETYALLALALGGGLGWLIHAIYRRRS